MEGFAKPVMYMHYLQHKLNDLFDMYDIASAYVLTYIRAWDEAVYAGEK